MPLNEFRPSFLTVDERPEAVVATVVKPRLTEEDNLEELGQELLTLVDQYQCQRLILSLKQVLFVTSAALGKLITLHRRLHRKQGRLVLCHADGAVAEVLRASRLHDYFTLVADVPTALVRVMEPA